MDPYKIYRLFSPCIPVKGYHRSLIADLNRHQLFYIPNTLYGVLKYGHSHSWAELVNHYGKVNEIVLKEYYQYLMKHELIFPLTKDECRCFPHYPLHWDYPSCCSNAIMDIGSQAQYDINRAIEKLAAINCHHIQIRFLSSCCSEDIVSALDKVHSFSFYSVQLCLKYQPVIEDLANTLFDNYWKLAKVEVFEAPSDKIIPKMGLICLLNYYKDKKLDSNCCGCVSTQYFSIETNHFTESQKHNTCLNRKLCIDANGYVKNCPAMEKHYGRIDEVSLEEVIRQEDFQQCWYINKDRIDVCKDCEFRHMCTDCRCFIKDPENIFSQPAKCTYNPYICKWQGEEGYVPVEECGIYSRETGFVPDKKKIKALNKKIWNEE